MHLRNCAPQYAQDTDCSQGIGDAFAATLILSSKVVDVLSKFKTQASLVDANLLSD